MESQRPPVNESSGEAEHDQDVALVKMPTIDECVRYLEKNQTMRLIIGLMMDCEQSNMTTTMTTPAETVRRYVKLMHVPPLEWRHLAAGDGDLPQADFESNSDSSNVVEQVLPSIPTLQELANSETFSAKFQKDSKTNEQTHKALLASLFIKTEADVMEAADNDRTQLREAPEARMADLLCLLQKHSEQKLDARFKMNREYATSRRKKIIENANKEREKIRAEWISRREAIFNDHQSCLKAYHDGQGIYDADGSSSTRTPLICFSPDCRNLFDRQAAPETKRCIVPGCIVSQNPYCGCMTSTCERCNNGVCKALAPSNLISCVHRERIRGFDGRTDTINPIYCNAGPLDYLNKCAVCECLVCRFCTVFECETCRMSVCECTHCAKFSHFECANCGSFKCRHFCDYDPCPCSPSHSWVERVFR